MSKRNRMIIISSVIALFAIVGGVFLFKGPSDKEKLKLTKQLNSYVEQGNEKKVKAFIEEHPKLINFRVDGATALQTAFDFQQYSIAKNLIDNNGETTQPMIQSATISLLDGIHMLAWSENQKKQKLELFKLIISKDKKNINVLDEEGNTPLHIATSKGDGDIVKLLLQNKANSNLVNKLGYNALHLSVIRGDLEIVRYISENDNDIIGKSNDMIPLLSLAVENSRYEIYDYLLKGNKINIDTKNEQGKTALAIAAENGDVQSVDYLIKNGANMEIKSKRGLTPYNLANESNHEEIMKLLK